MENWWLETTKEEKEMNMFFKTEHKLEKDLENVIEKFVRSAYRELSDAGYHSFWFHVKIKERTLCIYLYYDLDGEDSEKILSWQFHVQDILDKKFKKVQSEKYDMAICIMEAHDLWSGNYAEEEIETEHSEV